MPGPRHGEGNGEQEPGVPGADGGYRQEGRAQHQARRGHGHEDAVSMRPKVGSTRVLRIYWMFVITNRSAFAPPKPLKHSGFTRRPPRVRPERAEFSLPLAYISAYDIRVHSYRSTIYMFRLRAGLLSVPG
jgi:hypothetical protein